VEGIVLLSTKKACPFVEEGHAVENPYGVGEPLPQRAALESVIIHNIAAKGETRVKVGAITAL
jgi:hypothetical protein